MATAAAKVASYGSAVRGCMCSWKRPDTWPITEDLETKMSWCEYLRLQITQHGNHDDLWNGDPFIVTGKRDIEHCSDKVVALRMSLQRHVPGFKDKSNYQNFIVARHHFPRALLECRSAWNIKVGTTFLSKEQAELIAERDHFGSGRFTENCNKVAKLLATAGRVPSKPADGNKFVQAPVGTKIEAEDFTKSLLAPSTALRLQRRNEQKPRALFVTPSTERRTGHLLQAEENLEQPRTLFVSPNATPNTLPSSLASIRQTPQLPYQPEDRGVPSSPTRETPLPTREMPAPPSPDVCYPIEFCRDKIKQKFALYGNHPISLLSNQNFAICMHTLATFHRSFDPIKLVEGKGYLYPCHAQHPDNAILWKHDDCHGYSVRHNLARHDRGEFRYCAPCNRERKKCLRIAKLKAMRSANREHAVPSSRPYSSMSPETAKNCLRAKASEVKVMRRKLSCLKKKLAENKSSMNIPANHSSIRELVVNISGTILKDGPTAKQTIIDALLQIEANGTLNESSVKERKEFADHILSEISNMAKRMIGQKRKASYSPKLIRMVMALWLRDNKAYQEFQEANYYMLPTIAYLKDIKSSFQMRDGEDPKVYCRYKDERLRGMSKDGEVGHLMVDEIKLKSDIAFNCKNNEVVGFCSNNGTIDLRDEFASLIANNELSDLKKKTVVYANQWRFRSLYNKTHNAEYFFNSRGLTSDKLVRQLNNVVTHYEMSGVKIIGLVLDAGGPNAGLLKLLRRGEKVQGNWPSQSCLYCINPMDPDRKIWVFHCSTHNQKAMRNSLLRSQEKGTRDFRRLKTYQVEEGGEPAVKFGWGAVEEIYYRDEKRCGAKLAQLTSMTLQAAKLDQWDQMNVALSKAPFHVTSIVEMTVHLSQRLGCLDEIWRIKGDVEADAVGERKLVLCLEAIKRSITAETDIGLQSDILTLEYLLVIHRIFILRLMNKEYKLHKANLEYEEETMRTILTYFDDWMLEKQAYEGEGNRKRKRGKNEPIIEPLKGPITKEPIKVGPDSNWRLYFLADQTYTNLRLGVAGFFGYAREALFMADVPFVPALHSNQSSIEALFSWVRKMGRDKASNYGMGIGGRNAIRTNTAENILENNKMYSKDHITIEQEDLQHRNLILGQGIKEREKTLNKWILFRNTDDNQPSGTGVVILPLTMETEKTDLGNLVLPLLREKKLDNRHFSDFLLRNTVFKELAMLSIGGDLEKWFRTVCKGMPEEEENQFDETCQKLMRDIWQCLRRAATAKQKNSVLASRHYQLLTYMQGSNDSEFGRIIQGMPLEELRNRHAMCALCQRLSHFLADDWIPEALTKLRKHLWPFEEVPETEQEAEDGKVDLSKEVNHFFGWAIQNLTQGTRERFNMSKNPKKVNEEELVGRLELLKSMRVFEHEILDDVEYLEKFYCPFYRLLNDGYLTLVSPKYVHLGLSLLEMLGQAVNDEELKKNGSETLVKAVDSAKDRKGPMKRTFLELSHDIDSLTIKQKEKLFDELVDKTKNSRCGAVIRRFRSITTGRGAALENSIAFRTQIKALATRGKGGKAAALKREVVPD